MKKNLLITINLGKREEEVLYKHIIRATNPEKGEKWAQKFLKKMPWWSLDGLNLELRKA